jgi:hypothetical protein
MKKNIAAIIAAMCISGAAFADAGMRASDLASSANFKLGIASTNNDYSSSSDVSLGADMSWFTTAADLLNVYMSASYSGKPSGDTTFNDTRGAFGFWFDLGSGAALAPYVVANYTSSSAMIGSHQANYDHAGYGLGLRFVFSPLKNVVISTDFSASKMVNAAAEIDSIYGQINSPLEGDYQTTLDIRGTWKPASTQNLSINIGYRDDRVNYSESRIGSVVAAPALSIDSKDFYLGAGYIF